MKPFKHITVILLLLCAANFYCSGEPVILEPESKSAVDDEISIIVIRSNKKNVQVFLNDNFMGQTPLTVKGLVTGDYIMSVSTNSKDKSEKKQIYRIEVKRGLLQNYYVELPSAQDPAP
ncbi:PEGA domain-containing protein [Treponema parvum]|uniref:PEGA domain-containing protein n=1 Tax=Treponema parvum TaxID=138851 RepID=UPI001AEBDD0B|nr:PEGA domain-containing protein [Treponema parvum]QTQ16812.1 PEGA domain-containing protein [Treponema parvum]